MGIDAIYALGRRDFGMNPLRYSTLLRATLLVVAMTSTPSWLASAAFGQEAAAEKAAARKPAIQKLTEGIADLVKAAFGVEEQPAVAVAVEAFGMDAMPGVVTPESELKKRKARLDVYSQASTDWLDTVVSLKAEQKEALKTSLDGRITKSQLEAKKPKRNNRGSQRFSDHFAINFTESSGAAADLDFLRKTSLLAETNLTPEQQAALDAAKEERRAFHETATVGHILNILDQELYLTLAQRTSLEKQVRGKLNLQATCYALKPMNYYFQQVSIVPVLKRIPGDDLLGDAQRQRVEDLTANTQGPGSDQYVSFDSNDGIDSWQDQLRDGLKAQRARLMRSIAVRVDFYKGSEEMPDAAARRLLVAGKGATEKAIAQWKTTSLTQLKSYEQHAMQMGPGNFSFSLSVPDVQQLDNDPIWRQTVKDLLPNASKQSSERSTVRKDATANFIVAMLDRELWLTKKQRDAMFKAVRNKVPRPDTKIQNSNYFLEVTLLTIPLFKLSKSELAVLNESQQTVLAELKKPFQKQGSTVLVQMENGSQMHLRIPN